MGWLDRLKEIEAGPESRPFGTFGTPISEHIQESAPAATVPDPEFEPDRWCYPHSDAMNGAEIDLMHARLVLFSRRGLRVAEADRLADVLVRRDREGDDRRTCFECANLRGRQCAVPALAGAGQNVAPFVLMLQRCLGFREAGL